jgi:16S rRNA (cytosine1402-N4)-methyltransferase
MVDSYHTPVLVDAVLDYMAPLPDGVYVDGTLGGGGHAEAILKALSSNGTLIGIDRDARALERARRRLERFGERVTYVHDAFSNLKAILRSRGIPQIQGFLLDLGVSSGQIDEGERGFSFQGEGRIDMRMDSRQQLDGWRVVNTYTERRLADVLWKYGEERRSRRIAKAIVMERQKHALDTTAELARIVDSVAGGAFLHKTLSRVFQAIRIEVNGELQELQRALEEAPSAVSPGGRIVVIAYHSLEDRIVKEIFRQKSLSSVPSGNKYVPDAAAVPSLRVLTKKPVAPAPEEIARNVRARSAKLRAAERI